MVLASAEDWDHLSTGHYEELGTQALINASKSVKESENWPIAIDEKRDDDVKEVNDYNQVNYLGTYLLCTCGIY